MTEKTIRCHQPGLSQEQALAGLYETYGNVRVSSIRRQGTTWVAKIVLADMGSPVSDMPEDGGAPDVTKNEKPEGEAPSDTSDEDGGADGLPGEGDGDDGGEKKEKGKGGAEHEILHLLHTLMQGLTDAGIIQPSPTDTMVPGGEPGPTPPGGPPPPGPPGMGGPPGAGAMGKKPVKLGPGEVLPSQTPIGSPAFSSRQANAPCPKCGGQTLPDGTCPGCETKNPGAAAIAPPNVPGAPQRPIAGVKQATITVESGVLPAGTKASTAKRSLQERFASHGYKVKEIVPVEHPSGIQFRALLSIH